ncbi:hypothetical protein MBANPS3_000939 [Mucor bainieri]
MILQIMISIIEADFFENCYYDFPTIRPSFWTRYHQTVLDTTTNSEFLYNRERPNDVVCGRLAMAHYLKHPIDKQYTHVKSSLRELQQMYKIEGETVKESNLYFATKQFLITKYKKPPAIDDTAESFVAKTQFAIVLPMFLQNDEQFVTEILQSLFIEVGWVSESDYKSKLVFFGELESLLYAHQQSLIRLPHRARQKIIRREKRYLCCSINKDLYKDSLTLTLDIIQMRFDKDFIAASRSSISSSGTELLAPQFMASSKIITIQNCVSKKALGLPRFVLSRIFADSLDKISYVHGDLHGFYLNKDGCQPVRYSEDLILKLLDSIFDRDDSDGINECLDESMVSGSPIWKQLNQNERKNFSVIRQTELLKFMPSIDMSSIFDGIQLYAKNHGFILSGTDDLMIVDYVYCGRKDEYSIWDECLKYQSQEFYMLLLNSIRSGRSPASPFIRKVHVNLEQRVSLKILTMIELSNKLKEPNVLHSKLQQCNSGQMKYVGKKREQTILERLSGYSFYVEAKITRKNHIKLYLHQVIETQNGKEKSTLPIADASIEAGDMYDTICDALWHVSSKEQSSQECRSSLSVYGHYHNFKSKLLALLEEMFDGEISAERNIHDLQNIHAGNADCSCCIQISHQMILDMGVKHYLKGIAESIVACTGSPATFAKYKPKTIIITGSLLSKWTKLNNTLYRDFIWKQLEEELCLAIYQHQMKVHLIMSHTNVDCFPDEQLLKREKYQHVVGERRLLVNIESYDVSAKLYEDKGDRYELVPSIRINGQEHWRFHLIQDNETLLEQAGISPRYYISAKKEDFGIIEIYMCSPQDQQDAVGDQNP